MFKQSWKEFFSSKSNWTGMGMIAGGVIGLYKGADPTTSVSAIIGGFSLIFVRDSIAGVK